MGRFRDAQGSALVFALMTIFVIGVIASFALDRTSSGRERTGAARNQDRASQALNTGLDSALNKLQRVGSNDSNEFSCSILDEPTPRRSSTSDECPRTGRTSVNGKRYDNSDGAGPVSEAEKKMAQADGQFKSSFRVPGYGSESELRSSLTGFQNVNDPRFQDALRKRRLSVIGNYDVDDRAIVKSRRVDFRIVPRVFRYGLFVGSGAAGASSASLTLGGVEGPATVVLPPWYKARDARGSDLGVNGAINVNTAESGVNTPTTFNADSTNSDNDLIKRSFLRDENDAASAVLSGGLTFPASVGPDPVTSNQERVYGSNTPKLSLNPMAVRVAPPAYAKWLRTQRCAASDQSTDIDPSSAGLSRGAEWRAAMNCNAAADQIPSASDGSVLDDPSRWLNTVGNQTELYTPTDFQARLNAAAASSNKTLEFGASDPDAATLIYVNNEPDSNQEGSRNCTITVPSGATLRIRNGGLVVHGCDLLVEETASLVISREMTQTGRKVNKLPALIVHRNSDLPESPGNNGYGGSLTVHSSGNARTVVNGFAFVHGNLTMSANKPVALRGNLQTEGAFFVAGRATLKGRLETPGNAGSALPGRAVFKWNPIVQETDFRADTNQMGTYAARTFDRIKPQQIPSIIIDSGKPEANTTERNFTVRFHVVEEPDTVVCTIGGGPEFDCDNGVISNTSGPLATNQSHSFTIKACNVNGCDFESYSWQVLPGEPTIVSVTPPADPRPHTATSDVVGITVNSDGPVTVRCRLDRSTDGGVNWTVGTPMAEQECYRDENTGESNRTFTWNVTGMVPDTRYRVVVTVINAHTVFYNKTIRQGHTGSPQWSWRLRKPQSTVTITTRPNNPTVYPVSGGTALAPSNTFNFGGATTNQPSSVECRIYETGTTAPAFTTCTLSGTNWSRTYTNLNSCRTYTFEVRALNESGTGPASSYQFYYNCPTPTVTVTSPTSTPTTLARGTTAFTMTGTATNIVSGRAGHAIECSADNATWTSCLSTSTSWTRTRTGLPSCEAHTIFVRARNETATTASQSRQAFITCPAIGAWGHAFAAGSPFACAGGICTQVNWNIDFQTPNVGSQDCGVYFYTGAYYQSYGCTWGGAMTVTTGNARHGYYTHTNGGSPGTCHAYYLNAINRDNTSSIPTNFANNTAVCR